MINHKSVYVTCCLSEKNLCFDLSMDSLEENTFSLKILTDIHLIASKPLYHVCK